MQTGLGLFVQYFGSLISIWRHIYIQEPFYDTVHYKRVSDLRQFNSEAQKCFTQTKMYRLYRKNDHFWSFFYIIYAFLKVIFYIIYTFLFGYNR